MRKLLLFIILIAPVLSYGQLPTNRKPFATGSGTLNPNRWAYTNESLYLEDTLGISSMASADSSLLWFDSRGRGREITMAQLTAQILSHTIAVDYVETIPDLIAYTGLGDAVVVKDALQGGLFVRQTGMVVDSGYTFPGWLRAVTGPADAKWWGCSPSAEDNARRLNLATASPHVKYLIISDSLNFEQIVWVRNREGFHLQIDGYVRKQNTPFVTLSDNMSIGSNTVICDSAAYYFKVGDLIGIADTAAVNYSNATNNRRNLYNSAMIMSISDDTITIDSSARYNITASKRGLVFKNHNAIIFENCPNPLLDGMGVVDMNKDNSYDGDPVLPSREDYRAEGGVTFNECSGGLVKNLEFKNSMLHNIRIKGDINGFTFEDVKSHHSHDKNFLSISRGAPTSGIFPRNVNIIGGYYSYSDHEDGVHFDDGTDGLLLDGVTIVKNGRRGVSIADGKNFKMVNSTLDSNGVNIRTQDLRDQIISGNTIGIAMRYNYDTLTAVYNCDMLRDTGTFTNNTVTMGSRPVGMFNLSGEQVFDNNTYRDMQAPYFNANAAVFTNQTNNMKLLNANATYINIDGTKIYKGSTATLFGAISTSKDVIAMDRPNFATRTNRRNKQGYYTFTSPILVDTNNNVTLDPVSAGLPNTSARAAIDQTNFAWTTTGTAPNTITATYTYTTAGKMVTLMGNILADNAGTTTTALTIPLSAFAGLPDPEALPGLTAVSAALADGSANWSSSQTGAIVQQSKVYLRVNSTATGYNIFLIGSSISVKYISFTISWKIP